MHDISKLHPIHQQMYRDFVSNEYTPNIVPDSLYQYYLKLSKEMTIEQKSDLDKALVENQSNESN